MERIVEVDGKKLVIGLEWSKLAGDKPADAGKRLAASRKCPMGVLWSVSVEEEDRSSSQIVHSIGMSHSKFKGSVYSAAAALARAQASVIGIEQIDDDLYWMAVTENGRVLPGYDSIVSEVEARRKLQELAIDTQLDYMQFYMLNDVANRFGIDEAYDESPLSLIRTSGINESMRVRKMVSIPRAAYLGAGILMMGGSLFGYLQHVEAEKQRELEALMAEEAKSLDSIEKEITVDKVIDKGPTDTDLLRQARQQEIIWLRDDFNRINRLAAMKSMLIIAESLPHEMNGWELMQIVFKAENKDSINVLWNRTFGSPNSLKSFMEFRGNTGFTSDFAMGNSSMPVSLGSPGIRDILSIVKDTGLKHQDFASTLIESHITFESSVSEVKTRREPIIGLKDKFLESMPQLEASNRIFILSGSDLDSFSVAMKLLEPVDNFLLGQIKFLAEGSDNISWKVEGKLYE
jgi:hypothetical protein